MGLALIIAGILLVVGFAIFPSMHSLYGLVDTTGLSTIMVDFVTFAPYILFGLIFYGIMVVIRKRGG
jgi:hypothetical protein